MEGTHGSEPVTDPAFTKELLEQIVRGTRCSNAIPMEAQHEYNAATFPAYGATMAEMSSRLEGMMQGFLNQQGGGPASSGASTNERGDEVSARFDSVVELSDRLLERVDADLERQLMSEQAGSSPAGALQAGHAAARSSPSATLSSASANKPQLRWRDELDNHSNLFMPKLREKPNALAPLELFLEQTAASSSTPTVAWYANPYAPEIAAFCPLEVRSRLTLAARRRALFLPAALVTDPGSSRAPSSRPCSGRTSSTQAASACTCQSMPPPSRGSTQSSNSASCSKDSRPSLSLPSTSSATPTARTEALSA